MTICRIWPLIKIESPEPLPFLDLQSISPNLLGQTVLVLGNPVGYESSVSAGILSAKDRTLNDWGSDDGGSFADGRSDQPRQ